MMMFEKGDVEQGHTHHYDHLTLLASGIVKVTVEGKDTVFKAPHMLVIVKDKVHRIEALENGTVAYCVHAIRDSEGNIMDPDMLPASGEPWRPGLLAEHGAKEPEVRSVE
jgi:quercetin dioxygenase-like cupin family protein